MTIALACAASPLAAAAGLGASERAAPVGAPTAAGQALSLASFRDRLPGGRASLRRAAKAALAALERAGASPTALRHALRRLGGAGASEPLGPLLARLFTSGRREPEALVTGYYEPLLEARERRGGRFRHAIYAPPPPALRGASRAEIEAGALAGRGLELFWADDPIRLFFLHVQGSGRLDLGSGRSVRIGFAASNGRPYRSIGALLVERGVFRRPAEATAPAIEAYLRHHPGEAPAILRANPRYVFFRVLPEAEGGPPGALGAPLVAWRSVAVDPAVVPLGSVGLLRFPLPGGGRAEGLVLAMDSGAAIRGPARVDVFLGAGARAERLAGLLRARGQVVWLRPR